MLTSKQRAHLRGLASVQDTIFQIGKGGLTEQLTQQVAAALKARELIKLRVLPNADVTPHEAAAAVGEATGAETVCVIGSRFVLYKRNDKKPVIKL